MNNIYPYTSFSEDDMKAFEAEMKVGVVVTLTDEGYPHPTFLSSLRSCGQDELVWGQFSEGRSKTNILKNPKTAWLVMNLDKKIWFGQSDFTHIDKKGDEMDVYVNMAMFRYNAYMSIHTAYYMQLIHHTGKHALPIFEVGINALRTAFLKPFMKKTDKPVMNDWTSKFMSKIGNVKFLAYLDENGYPAIVPALQINTLGSDKLIFADKPYNEILRQIKPGSVVSVMGMSFDMEVVVLRGVFQGWRKFLGSSCGVVDIDWIYNPMPPKAEQIYPPLPLEPVVKFE
ncbi:MAG: pyridoxamine 5'-phosphate oxidase family protein [Anaerolineaceae bacterium]|nr:pyridoxamine 5'-phosphate oxidase family protein [Anaerolineaceae bacterium]